jgi:hypothetical protein
VARCMIAFSENCSRGRNPAISPSCITATRVADPQHFFHIAADHDDGHTPVRQFSHQPVDLGLGPGVNAARRFVKRSSAWG